MNQELRADVNECWTSHADSRCNVYGHFIISFIISLFYLQHSTREAGFRGLRPDPELVWYSQQLLR